MPAPLPPVPLRRRMGSDHLVSALGPWQPITRNFTLRDGHHRDNTNPGGYPPVPGDGEFPRGSHPTHPISPVGPRGGQGPVAGCLAVLAPACCIPTDPQHRAGHRAGVGGRCCLQGHVGVGGGQPLVEGDIGTGRGVSEGGRGCVAQAEG